MRTIYCLTLVSACLLLIFSSCKDENNTTNNTDPIPIDTMQIEFGCIYQFDAVGQALNNCMDDEWQVDYEFSNDELGYLDFGDTLDFQGANEATLQLFQPYPNPATDVIYFSYTIDMDAYCKLVFLDENYDRKFVWHGLLSEENQTFGLNISELENQYFRIYYSFSADGNEDFAGGFGDISIQN